MLKVRIIPCLDVEGGRVVKGVHFVDLVDAGDPVEQARVYDAAGADELCFLDITASHENRDTILDVVARTAEQCFMPLTVGGGVRSIEDIRRLLLAGADKVSINTAAVNGPGVRRRGGGEVRQPVHRRLGRRQDGGARPVRDLHPRRAHRRPASTPSPGRSGWSSSAPASCCVTSMDRDGTKAGFDIPLTRAIADAVPVPVIASGGVGTLDHLVEGVRDGHASAVLAASIFHFGTFTIAEAKAPHARGRASRCAKTGGCRPARWPLIPTRRVLDASSPSSRAGDGGDPATARTPPSCSPQGRPKIARKVGEEAVEVVVAALGERGPARRGKRRSPLSPAGAVGRCRRHAGGRVGASWPAARAPPGLRKRRRAGGSRRRRVEGASDGLRRQQHLRQDPARRDPVQEGLRGRLRARLPRHPPAGAGARPGDPQGAVRLPGRLQPARRRPAEIGGFFAAVGETARAAGRGRGRLSHPRQHRRATRTRRSRTSTSTSSPAGRSGR